MTDENAPVPLHHRRAREHLRRVRSGATLMQELIAAGLAPAPQEPASAPTTPETETEP